MCTCDGGPTRRPHLQNMRTPSRRTRVPCTSYVDAPVTVRQRGAPREYTIVSGKGGKEEKRAVRGSLRSMHAEGTHHKPNAGDTH